MFAKRFMSAVVLLAFAVVALVGGGTFLLAVSGVVALAGTYEFLKVDHMNKSVPGYICYVLVIGFYLMLYLRQTVMLELWLVLVILFLLSAYVFVYPRYHIHNMGVCLFSVLYVGVLVSYVYQTRTLPGGNWLVWLILISASGSDTFAYLTGMLMGKHHFSELSPKKTIEGCVGGVIGAALLALVYSFAIPEGILASTSANIHALFACIGAIGSVVSQIGDLAASAVKRNFGIKDYSNLIPGHGGILDRFDSILFVAPVVYYVSLWLIKG